MAKETTQQAISRHNQTIEDHEQRISDLEERTSRIGKEVREANLRSREAHVGYVEASVNIKYLSKDLDEIKHDGKIHNRWLIGIFLSVIGLIITLIKLLS